MITRRPLPWQVELSQAFRDPLAMLAALGLIPESLSGATSGKRWEKQSGGKGISGASTIPFPLLAPRGYVARMQKGNPRDPLLRQVLPIAEENTECPGYTTDPLGECHALRAPGVLQKYQGRVLLMTTTACAVHCRYCFRRHFALGHEDGGIRGKGIPNRDWETALACIRKEDTIREVILSGGDPLCVIDEKLALLAARIAELPHVRRLRIHTRVPIVLPERVDDSLLAWLAGTRLQMVMVIHANHPNEMDHRVEGALARLRVGGITLLNQSVLLRGVNDHPNILATLSERLFAAGVLPYYLHLLDPVQGAAHFAVAEGRVKEIMTGLRSRLPGYLVPRPVREVAGAGYKIPA